MATLRGPGIGLEAVRAVLDEHQTPADVASIHARALEDEIAGPRLRRAVLAAVTRRKPDKEEMRTMHDLARLTAAERERLVDAFVTDTFGGRDTSAIGEHMRRATPALPDDPTSEQIDAWIEVAESSLRTKASAGGGARWPRPANSRRRTRVRTAVPSSRPPSASTPAPRWPRGNDPASDEAEAVLARLVPGSDALERAALAARLRVFTDECVERYWQLVGVINGWPPFPPATPAFLWFIDALEAPRGDRAS